MTEKYLLCMPACAGQVLRVIQKSVAIIFAINLLNNKHVYLYFHEKEIYLGRNDRNLVIEFAVLIH
jgi:hypothetical protein